MHEILKLIQDELKMFQLFEILSAIQLRIDSAMIGSRIQGSRLHSSRSRPIIAELIRIEIGRIKSRNRVWIITKFHEDSQTSYSWCNSHICLLFRLLIVSPSSTSDWVANSSRCWEPRRSWFSTWPAASSYSDRISWDTVDWGIGPRLWCTSAWCSLCIIIHPGRSKRGSKLTAEGNIL